MNLIDCECGKQFSASLVADRVDHEPGVFAVGLRCPHCSAFYLSYYEDKSIVELRKSLQRLGKIRHRTKHDRRLHDTTLDQFSRQFDQLQERMT